MKERFWFVWNPNGRTPSCIHRTEESANAEAERLARLSRGQVFIVLESRREFVADDLKVTPHGDVDDELPF